MEKIKTSCDNKGKVLHLYDKSGNLILIHLL